MFYEKIIREIIAFAGPKQWSDFEEAIKKDSDIEKIYAEFIVNRNIPYIDIISMIKKHEKDLPQDYKEKFVKHHKEIREKQEDFNVKGKGTIVAQVDKFTILNRYTNLTQEKFYEEFKAVLKLIQEVVDKMKARSFDSVLYGNIILSNPSLSRAIATYNYITDDITLKLYKEYNTHAVESVIHELAHRIWYVLMENKDRNLWIKEYNDKMHGSYGGKYPGFPTQYSQKNEKEYFAVCVEVFISNGKKFSELIDQIV
jgi:hypothetical protein